CASFSASSVLFFFQAEDGIRYRNVTGVQTCALPIYFAIIRGDRRCHAAKIGQSIIIDPDPVPDIAFGHSFSVKVITIGEGSDKRSEERRVGKGNKYTR